MKMTICLLAGLTMLSQCAPAMEAETIAPVAKEKMEVVFVLDSTGSMSGLIAGAKDKIWSIANSIAARKPLPEIRLGLVSYRDKGDEYVTRRFDLTNDIDAVFANLQTVSANGGGDSPESVNQALHEAVTMLSWTEGADSLKTIFLVGDCPPHMDYQDDVKYHDTCQLAAKRGIVINTVQCGSDGSTTPIWKEIAKLAEGSYVALQQSGNMTVIETPYDADISKVNSRIAGTVVAYGGREQVESVSAKVMTASVMAAPAAADRASFNLAAEGRAIQGAGDLVADLDAGQIDLETLGKDELPADLRDMSGEERKAYVETRQEERTALNKELDGLLKQRAAYVNEEKQRQAAEGKGDAFDEKVADMINEQAARAGK